jgi:hypothetical protein
MGNSLNFAVGAASRSIFVGSHKARLVMVAMAFALVQRALEL